MTPRLIHRAVAETFVRTFMQRSANPPPLGAREVIDRCRDWCNYRHVFSPTASEVAEAMRSLGGVRHKSNGQRMWLGLKWRDQTDWIAEITDADELRKLARKSASIPLAKYCRMIGIARSTFYAQMARYDAPPVYRHSGRNFIKAADAMEWCAARDKRKAMVEIMDWLNSLDSLVRSHRGSSPGTISDTNLHWRLGTAAKSKPRTARSGGSTGGSRTCDLDITTGYPLNRTPHRRAATGLP